MSDPFTDRVVLVTGGSRGLGLELARTLLRRGARVAICARDRDELRRACEDLRPDGEVLAVPCDVTDPRQVRRLVAQIERDLGPIEAVFNNAGQMLAGPFPSLRREDFEAQMQVNLWGPLNVVQEVLPGMIARGRGRVVNIGSVGGRVPIPHLAPYTVSKHALVGLSRAMRVELAQHGINVTTVIPGPMRTGGEEASFYRGAPRAEHRWFALVERLPFTTTSPERAARRIVAAAARGRPEVVFGVVTRCVVAAFGVWPGVGARLTALANRLLPRAAAASDPVRIGRDLGPAGEGHTIQPSGGTP